MATSTNYPAAACATEMNFDLDFHSINIVDLDLRDDTLYLIAEETVKQEFSKIENRCAILRNMKGRVLVIVKGGKMAVFEEMSDSEIAANAPRTQFIIQHYKETTPKGLAVAISVKTEKKIYTLSCKDKKLHFKEGAASDKIDYREQDILFYQERILGHDKMQFKSFLYPEYYLACKQEKKGIFKLILKKGCQDEEGSTKFIVHYECGKTDSLE